MSVGDAVKIRASNGRHQNMNRRDAAQRPANPKCNSLRHSLGKQPRGFARAASFLGDG